MSKRVRSDPKIKSKSKSVTSALAPRLRLQPQVLEGEDGAAYDEFLAHICAAVNTLDYIERIDRLTTIAESRRNASLHELDRRRAVLSETLRRSVQEIEDGEFEVIETTPAKGKNAA